MKANQEKYEFISMVSEMNNTRVYKAQSIDGNDSVIIKTSATSHPTANFEKNLEQEYELLSKLQFNGIAKPVELTKVNGNNAIIFKDKGNTTLLDFIGQKEIDDQSFNKIAIQIVDVLCKIHEKGIIHKDINPRNILIDTTTLNPTIIDFGLASDQNGNATWQTTKSDLQGTLQYISPEQTGRINQTIDHRTDLYSLGITFYHMLAGRVPFDFEDPLTLIHCHIAREIDLKPLEERKISKILISIIDKLTKKEVGARYQSAVGLLYDLKEFEKDTSVNFELCSKDVSQKFSLPDKLYGRGQELENIIKILRKSEEGENNILIVHGSSGTGKTALVHEVKKNLHKENGYFISGKFNQYKTNIPFHAFALAFTELIRQSISKNNNEIDALRDNLKEVLGLNLSVMVGLVPDILTIVEERIEIPELNIAESQNRFLFTITEFIKIFATKNNPLTIFLDDMQWSDDSSLSLLHNLSTRIIPHFTLICAYRTNEVFPGHPLVETIERIKKESAIHEIELEPLKMKEVNQMVADCLNISDTKSEELSEHIYKLTKGNPLYITEILNKLHGDKIIKLNYNTGEWNYDFKDIKSMHIGDDVVNIIIERIRILPENCLDVLRTASCVGYFFDLKTLSTILGIEEVEISKLLWPSIQENLIIPQNDYSYNEEGSENFDFQYKFKHDKIQQAVYQSIPKENKIKLHYDIGKLLYKKYENLNLDDYIIEITQHLNESIELISDEKEKIDLAKMNIRAGNKSQSSIAYKVALVFFETALNLLESSSWDRHYQLLFDAHYGFAQNAYQIGRIDEANDYTETLLKNVNSKLERAKVLSMRLRQFTTIDKHEEAIKVGIEGLKILGVKISQKPGQLTVLKEILTIKNKLRKMKDIDLLEYPAMEDKEKLAAARIIAEIGPAAYITGDDNLYALASLKIVNLSLDYGNCPESSYAYVAFGAVLGEAFGDYKGAEYFGDLAIKHNLRINNIEYRCRILAAYGVLIHQFTKHWSKKEELFKKGIEVGYQSGDKFFIGYCAANCIHWNQDRDLESSHNEQLKYLTLIENLGFDEAKDTARLHLHITKNHIGKTTDPLSLNDEDFNEEQYLQSMISRNYLSGIGMYYITKAYLASLYNSHYESVSFAKKALSYKKSLFSNIQLIFLCRVRCFSSIQVMKELKPYDFINKFKLQRVVKSELKKMRKWADFNPENFRHIQFLLEAEWYSYKGDFTNAAILYEKSIMLAKTNNWPYDHAYACERLGIHYQNNKLDNPALDYLYKATELYNAFGAIRKRNLLKELYSLDQTSDNKFNNEINTSSIRGVSASVTSNSYDIDMDTIIRTSHAISGEIVLNSLVEKMIKIIMMNVGADRAVVLIQQDGSLLVQASGTNDGIETLDSIPLSEYSELPISLINFVAHFKESVVLNDAKNEGKFTNDDYIKSHNIKSVICSPIIMMNKLNGIIYLENNISTGAFTGDRLNVLNLLSVQMAISLQNALLYANLEQKVTERTSELNASLERLKATQAQLVQSEKMASLGELTAGIAHEIQNPLNFVNNFSDVSIELSNELVDKIKTLSLDENDKNDITELISFISQNQEKINFHGKRADAIMKAMLQHSRRDSGQKESTDINMLVDEFFKLAYHGLRANDKTFNVNMKTEYDPNMRKIDIIQQDMSRVFLNVITNAFYAVNEKMTLMKNLGKPFIPTVTIKTKSNPNNITIVVSDNGTGIPQKVIDKIFQPFFTTKPTGQGTGLGLSLSYDIVKSHEGELAVSTKTSDNIEDETGSEFTIIIPA